MVQKTWDVYVQRNERSIYIGKVTESSESLARNAALCRYGVGADEIDAGEAPAPEHAIYPQDDFSVSPTN